MDDQTTNPTPGGWTPPAQQDPQAPAEPVVNPTEPVVPTPQEPVVTPEPEVTPTEEPAPAVPPVAEPVV